MTAKGRPLNKRELEEWEKAFQDIEDSIKEIYKNEKNKIK